MNVLCSCSSFSYYEKIAKIHTYASDDGGKDNTWWFKKEMSHKP